MLRFRIRTNWTNSVSETHEFDLEDLTDAGTRNKLGGPSRAPIACGRPRASNRSPSAWLRPSRQSRSRFGNAADEDAASPLKNRTLTNLYNTRPQWLADAHQALDAAVPAAYGWPADVSDNDALTALLAPNGRR